MKKCLWMWLWSLPLVFVSGCELFERAVAKGPDIVQGGETAVEIGTGLVLFRPEIGLWILTAGGLAVAVGKMLLLFKER